MIPHFCVLSSVSSLTSLKTLITLILNSSVKYINSTLSIIVYLFINSWRYTKRGRHIDRGRSRLPAGNLMWDSIQGPWDHDLSQSSTTESPRCPLLQFYKFIEFLKQHSGLNVWFPFLVRWFPLRYGTICLGEKNSDKILDCIFPGIFHKGSMFQD